MQPTTLFFGTAGIPISTKPSSIVNGVKQIKKLGLESMEIEFVHGITIKKEETAQEIKKTAETEQVMLSCHGPYFVNLNAQEEKKKHATMNFIKQASEMASLAGAYSICFHMAYLMGMPKEKVTKIVIQRLNEIISDLQSKEHKIWVRPETAGRITQWGEIEDIIEVSTQVDQVLPCVDFAHLFAHSIGKNNSNEFFHSVLEKIEKGLGKEALKNMHCHMEGIEFTEKGEKKHVTLKECKFNFQGVLKALKEFNCKGIVTCESPNLETDALILKKEFEKIG